MIKKEFQPIEDSSERARSIDLFKKTIERDVIQKLTQGHYSASSVMAITSDWNRFVTFCSEHSVIPIPASHTAIRMFLESEAKHRKFSSVRRYSNSIGLIHKIHAFKDPCTSRQIKLVLTQIRLEKNGDERQASAFTSEHLQLLEKILRKDNSPRNLRDLAIYYVMFECALKRTDLRYMNTSQITFEGNVAKVSINSNAYRLSQAGSSALRCWLDIASGPGICFRRIDKHGHIGQEALDDSSIYRVLRRASDTLNLSEEMRFTTQSVRVGAAKELKKQGYVLKDIQEFGRWQSPAMPAQYLDKHDTAESEKDKFKTPKPWE